MLVAFFRIRYCKARMVAYVNGELPAAARRRMARYIEQYPECYAEYIHQRDAARDLQAKLPLVGQPEQPALDRMWSAIQAELAPRPQPRKAAAPFRLSYGVVGVTVALALILPFTFGGNRAAFALSLSQPAPLIATAQASDTSTPTTIGMLISVGQNDVTPPAPALPQPTAVSTD